MEEKTFKIKNVQLVFRRSTPLLKVLVIVLVVFSMAALIALGWVQHSLSSQTEELRAEAAALEQENRDYAEKIADLGSVASMEEIAREELGLVRPDTIIIKPEN